MPSHFHRPPRPRRPPAEVLLALACSLDDSCRDIGADDPAHLLRVVDAGDGADGAAIEVGLLPLELGADPVEAMVGFTAPSTWVAVGLVTSGRSHELTGEEAGGGCAGSPIRLTFLLDRYGVAVTLLTPLGLPRSEGRLLREPPAGAVADACRRMLELPTAPPDVGPEMWLTARWLDRMLAVVIDDPGAVPSWDAAVGLHPLVTAGAVPAPEAVAALAVQTGSQLDWEQLRLLATRGGGHGPISPAVASWMDAGSFARHMLASELSVDLLVAELEALVPPGVMAAVRRATPAGCFGPGR